MTRDGVPVKLGGRAFEMLLTLAQASGALVPTEALMARLWPDAVVEPGSLRVHMAGLRKTLGRQDDGSPWIENQPGKGYRLLGMAPSSSSPAPSWESGRAEPAPQSSADDYLPIRITSSIGREPVIQALVDGFPQRRLVTIVGPGGIGKTTVGLEAARRLAGSGLDGVRFVDLTALSDPQLLPSTLAQALGVRVSAHDPTASLMAYLAPTRMLMVLDGCECVVEAAALLAERLLTAAPGLLLLATSREPLRIRGEWVVRLPPLDLPDTPTPDLASAPRYSALALFMERSAAAGGPPLAQDDMPALVQLCRKLDGNPLALEIAAARTSTFGVRGLLGLLDERLSLLSQGRRTSPQRHHTLQATLDWSYRTLSDSERAILRRLSVFRSRFTFEAAATVSAFAPVRADEVFDGLEGLIAKSLLVTDSIGGAVGLRLLDTTRAYAADKLAESGESHAVALRHVAACQQLFDAFARDSGGLASIQWNVVHGALIEDIRAALLWAFNDPATTEAGVRLAAATGVIWVQLSRSAECVPYLQQALQHVAGLPDARALEMALYLTLGQCQTTAAGPTPETLDAYRRAGAAARAEGNTRFQLLSLYGEFGWHHILGRYADTLSVAQAFDEVVESASYAQCDLLRQRLRGIALFQVGRQHESLAIARALAESPPEGIHFFLDSQLQIEHQTASLTHLARSLWITGHTAQAQEVARRAVEVSLAFGHAISTVQALTMAACPIALYAEDWATARANIAQLSSFAQRHSFHFWNDWAKLFELALHWCESVKDPTSAPEWLALCEQTGSRADVLATLCPSLATEAVLATVETGPETWCTAELLRVKADKLLQRAHEASGPAARSAACPAAALALDTDPVREADRLLSKALEMATRQGARAWERRITGSIAQLRRWQDSETHAR
ncbi:ATP-binding protein [Roseateles depolymerans]|uniref:ATP-binding protein n=1 Tax=Roseateles depolymerans TaxID=76731 RepID=UPI001B86486D|nr:winged helix-turn-helix domain-containing protein [Roseateles depolymerans]